MSITVEDLLLQQNNLLEHQNSLLMQMNNLLQAKNSVTTPIFKGGIDSEQFIENIDTDEMRSGFLVTSHKKKLWNVQIKLINEFARICKKHNLRWFAGYGTLLGAARHKGFIPWDDDVDLIMLRPDYQKFMEIATEELKYPYYFDDSFNYRTIWDKTESPEEINMPLISDSNLGWPFCNFFKIRDSNTSLIEFPNRKNINQGIWIDIFPLESVPPFNELQQNQMFDVAGTLYYSVFHPTLIEDAINQNQPIPIDLNSLKEFLQLTYRQRGFYFENFLKENFVESQYIGRLEQNFSQPKPIRYKAEWFNKVEYLPFEKIELPCPANYDEILKADYGDWHQMIFTHSHAQFYSADIPYTEYLKKSLI